MNLQNTSSWDAVTFFRTLTQNNILAQQNNFTFCVVSGLTGFEDALHNMQNSTAFVCVSDETTGYTELNNAPHTRRVKTVFMAMRHQLDNMQARNICMETMREIFRQFLSVLSLQETKLKLAPIFLEPKVSFNEMDIYFLSGCACAFFQLATTTATDLRLNNSEWTNNFIQNLWT